MSIIENGQKLCYSFSFLLNLRIQIFGFLHQQIKQKNRMHPKRFRQRIEKAERFLHSRNFGGDETARNYDSTDSQVNQVNQLQKAVLDLAVRIQSAIQNKDNYAEFHEEMEPRDHFVKIKPPKLAIQKAIRQRQIKLWLSQITSYIFSISFNYFSHKVFDTQTMKIFTSQSCLINIIALSKNNELTKEDYELINTHLRKQILPYFLLRYPQSNNKEVNQKLNKSVSATDSLDNNENNMILKSKVKFVYRQNGIYFDFIMRFLNYIQLLPDQQLSSTSDATMFDDFNEKMQKIFTSVYNRKWTESSLYDQYNSENWSIQKFRLMVLTLESEMIDKKTKKKKEFENTQQKDYEDIVKEYTRFFINRKISENVQLYTEEEINYGNIKILDPSMLRIIIKWCSQLEEKFKPDYYIERDEPFVMFNGDEVQMDDQVREKLNHFAQEQWRQIQTFLSNIQNNIYQKQAELSFRNLMYYSSQQLPEDQESIIKFANRNTVDVHHFAVYYLNRLIHSLMKISHKIYDMYLQNWAEWPYPPIFLSFTISDLMRCKCFSKQKQIVRIYKQLESQSVLNPHILKIVKVKNRLNKGTKDILLNVMFHKQILCQIQLAIKVQLSQFSLWSDKFNHYIYELQRSTFGPVSELCSIWSSLDQRSCLLRNEKIRVQQFNHSCDNAVNVIQIFPFSCNVCFKHYSQSRYIYNHYKCGKCEKYWICALCQIKTLSQEELVNELKSNSKDMFVTKMIKDETMDFPEYFVGFKLQSMAIIGQKFRKFNVGSNTTIINIKQNKLNVRNFKKGDKKAKKKLFQTFIFFQQSKPDTELQKLSLQQVIDETILQEISQCYSKKVQSLRITKMNLTAELLTRIKDVRGQSRIVSLSCPQNNIESLMQIASTFPNIVMLNLSKNKIKKLSGLSKLTQLTDLYLGQNQFKEIVELQNLTNLKYLQLGDNVSSPQFKCSLSRQTKLQSLTLIRSNLGSFPVEVTNLKNLKLLWLFENRISIIPPDIGKLKCLQYLHLQMNQITLIPDQIYSLSSLKKLMLSFNKIENLSEKVKNLQRIQIISLENNPLKEIPFSVLDSLPCLQIMVVSKEYQQKFYLNKLIKNILFK